MINTKHVNIGAITCIFNKKSKKNSFKKNSYEKVKNILKGLLILLQSNPIGFF
jgi:hypothetical protein